VAQGLTAYDPRSGARIGALDLQVAMPSHLAVEGDGEARVFAALVGGQIEPSGGRLTFAGVDLMAADPESRARRIAFAGGDTILLPGSLRQNLAYGCPEADGPELDRRLAEAATVAGLDGLIHARGLAGAIDPAREPRLAAAVVDARRAVQTAIQAGSLSRFVDPFDPTRYNHHATIGENLLLGVPLGDTFREENLAGHPFVRAILEADGLLRPLTAMGVQIAQSMIEIFSGIPDGHPLFDRFSFFAASDRGYFEDLVERRAERRRGAETARDRERLIGLALRYSESRHRLGLLDAEMEAKIVSARGSFRELLPVSLQPAIEFYDPDRICAAASVQDNLLFGRVAQDQAGSVEEVRRIVRRVLTERGLDGEVMRIGLDSRVDPRGEDLLSHEIAAIDLARCLVRRPDVVVAERALDGLNQEAADALVRRLRRALVGRGLILVAGSVSSGMDQAPFDAVLRFDRGAATLEHRRRAPLEPVPA
jgi:ABC-type thiamine transport system ATPase subunit